MSDRDHWIVVCLDAAEEASRKGEFPNGACVVVEDQLVGVSASGTEFGADPTAHAEVLALRSAAASGRLAPGATLFTTLEPCAMCLHSAAVAGVTEIVFGSARSDVGDAAYVSRLDAKAMAEQLYQPLTLTHYGDPTGRVAQLVAAYLAR